MSANISLLVGFSLGFTLGILYSSWRTKSWLRQLKKERK